MPGRESYAAHLAAQSADATAYKDCFTHTLPKQARVRNLGESRFKIQVRLLRIILGTQAQNTGVAPDENSIYYSYITEADDSTGSPSIKIESLGERRFKKQMRPLVRKLGWQV